MRVPAAGIYFPGEDRERILRAIDDTLKTGQLTLGKHGKAFEEAFAARVGVKYAVAVSSGTSALEIIRVRLFCVGRVPFWSGARDGAATSPA